MAEYIEREALRAKAVYMHGFGNNKYVPLRAIKDAPAADVAPIVHGRWKERFNMVRRLVWDCSECDVTSLEHGLYCPNCGARMDGE